MSTIPAFVVGVVVSQAGYVYLSDHIVQPRNRVIQGHFNRDGAPATYEPDHAVGIRRVSQFSLLQLPNVIEFYLIVILEI